MTTPIAEPVGISEERKRALLKRISTARLVTNSYCRFFAHLVGKTVAVIAEPHHNVPTAAVSPDGYVYFNPDFMDTLSDAELAGLVIHETLHPALLCWRRQGTRKAQIVLQDGRTFGAWNLAHDLSFNPDIIELANKCRCKGKIKLPPAGAVEAKYVGMAAEAIYDDLLKTMKKAPNSGGTKFVPGKDGVPGLGKAQGAGIGDDLRPDLAGTETGKRAATGDKTAQQKIANNWRVSVIAAAQAHERKHGRGHLPGGIAKMVAELLDHKIDWVDVLSQWIGENGNKEDFTMRRPRRRFDPNVLYLPSTMRTGIDDVIVLWDTSGSMNGREKAILSEVQGICEDLGLKLRIICCDAAVHTDVRDVESAIDIIGKIIGGGGSDFTPAFDLLEEECYEGIVVCFTDGHIGVPVEKPALIRDVLWCIEPAGKSSFGDVDPTARTGHATWGEVLLMEES